MRGNKLIPIIAAAAMFGLAAQSKADPVVALFDYGYNIDGDISNPLFGDAVPGGVNESAFDDFEGIGTITATVSGAGSHNVMLWVNHDIDDVNLPQGNTFFNENGEAVGTNSDPSRSWEIDDPDPFFGDIIELGNGDPGHFFTNTLDDSNNDFDFFAGDISMAMGFTFVLEEDEVANISFTLSREEPLDDFFLVQTDFDSEDEFGVGSATIYFTSGLSISIASLPEPGTLALIGLGLIGVAGIRRRRA